MININIKGKAMPFYDFMPKEWYAGRFYVGASLCKIKLINEFYLVYEDFNLVKEQGYMNYGLGDLVMTIFEGSIDHQIEKTELSSLTLSDYSGINQLLNNYHEENGYYILITNKLSKATENNYNDTDVSFIAGITLLELGLHAISEVIFTKSLELTWHSDTQSFFDTIVLSLSTTQHSPIINRQSLWSIAHVYHTMKNLDSSNHNNRSLTSRVELSLEWFLLSIKSNSVNQFISLWIAIEALIMNGNTDLKILKEAIAKAYHVPINQIEEKFFIGRMFSLRSKIVHRGKRDSIPHTLLEYASCLYKDLLYSILGLPCNRVSETYLSNNSSIIEYFNTINLK